MPPFRDGIVRGRRQRAPSCIIYRNLGAHANRPTYRCRDRAVRVDVLVHCSVNTERQAPFVRQVEIARLSNRAPTHRIGGSQSTHAPIHALRIAPPRIRVVRDVTEKIYAGGPLPCSIPRCRERPTGIVKTARLRCLTVKLSSRQIRCALRAYRGGDSCAIRRNRRTGAGCRHVHSVSDAKLSSQQSGCQYIFVYLHPHPLKSVAPLPGFEKRRMLFRGGRRCGNTAPVLTDERRGNASEPHYPPNPNGFAGAFIDCACGTSASGNCTIASRAFFRSLRRSGSSTASSRCSSRRNGSGVPPVSITA